MKHLFVPYELAIALKEKGFNEPCFTYWFTVKGDNPQLKESDVRDLKGWVNGEGSNTTAPLYQQVIDWLRDTKDIQINIEWNRYYEQTPFIYTTRPTWRNQPVRPFGYSGMCNTYYNALEHAIYESLKHIQ